jgi:cell division transport system permease protein
VRPRLFLAEAVRSIGGNISTTAAAVMTVIIGMFLLGLFIVLGTWVLSWTNHVKKDIQVNVYFCTEQTRGCESQEATPAQIKAVGAQLAANPDVKSTNFVSKQEALDEMQKRFPELVEDLARNPLPAKWEVTPKRAEDAETIANSLEPVPAGVGKVDYGEKKAKRVLYWAKLIGGIVLVGAIILLVASTILIANTIRLSIFSRRREIEVMKLVGATNWFVRAPFMLEGLLCGLLGALFAVTLLLVANEVALSRALGGEDEVNPLAFPFIALILIGVSLLVGAAGSGITLRRFLRI